MITKLVWVGIISRLFYAGAALALVGGLVLSVTDKEFFWPGFLWAFSLGLIGLVLDVLAEIGKAIRRMETEQALIRTWIQQLHS